MTLVPFALQLYEEHRAGRSAAELAAMTGIPLDRVEQRLRAARDYVARQSPEAASTVVEPACCCS